MLKKNPHASGLACSHPELLSCWFYLFFMQLLNDENESNLLSLEKRKKAQSLSVMGFVLAQTSSFLSTFIVHTIVQQLRNRNRERDQL